MSDKAIEEWTFELTSLAPDLDKVTAHAFVKQLYETARRDLDEERSEADYEREE